MYKHNRYIICYPGGSGGAFLASTLSSIINNTELKIDKQLGHCHYTAMMPNFFHGDTIQSFCEELNNIQSFNFVLNRVVCGHYRNIVAIKETLVDQLGYNELEKIKFIKICVDHQKSNEILFVATMLKRKENCFPELSFDQYLIQTTNYIKSWYWIENEYTKPQTINLSLDDIFLKKVSAKLDLSAELSAKIDQCQDNYINVQTHLHKDLLELLYER